MIYQHNFSLVKLQIDIDTIFVRTNLLFPLDTIDVIRKSTTNDAVPSCVACTQFWQLKNRVSFIENGSHPDVSSQFDNNFICDYFMNNNVFVNKQYI